MRRPIVPLVVMFLLGIMSARHVSLPPTVLLLFPLLMFGLALMCAAYGRSLPATIFLLLLFFALGAGRLAVELRLLPSHHVDRLTEELLDQPIRVEGVVVSPTDPMAGNVGDSDADADRTRVVIDLRTIWLEGRQIEVTGRARLTFFNQAIAASYGDRVRALVKVRKPRGYLNPGGFDHPLYLRTQGISLEGWAGGGGVVESRGTGEGIKLLGWAYGLRERMIRAVRRLLPTDQAALLVAVTLGERSGIPRWMSEAFLGSGTYHIVAISGLNVSLLAGALFFFLKAIRVPPRASALLSMGLITFYAAMAGGSPSVVRAAVMADVYLLAFLLDREADPLNTLALSALALLLWQPLFLFDVGFQLTFVATWAILIAVDRVPLRSLKVPWRWGLAGLVLSAAAFLATAPILALTFHRISPIGILANLPIVPISALLTAAGMVFALLATVIPQALGLLSALIGYMIDLLVNVAGWFSRLPFASVRLFSPSMPMVACFYVALGAAAAATGRRWLRWIAASAALACVMLVVARLVLIAQDDTLRVTALDVGQGDAVLVELPGGRTILIDGGGLFDDRFDIGEQVVVPFLLSRWVSRLDLVVLSHPHPDHLNGLKAVLRHFQVGQVWDGGQRVGTPNFLWFQEMLRERQIPHKIHEAGYRTLEFDPVEITVLHPPGILLRGSRRGRSSDINSNSLVLAVQYRDVRILLPGDIEEEAERLLLERRSELAAQVLKVPHHGGRTSSSISFLQRVRPAVAIVSAGYRNRFRHPHHETLERYRALGISVFRTDQDGAVTVTTDGKTIDVTTARGSRWSTPGQAPPPGP